ncbi:uncharacterized protein LOC124861302 isoform X1 [Girardinichthys multiradiatus]|uniref:uncharacterized protein LOC124861302 isoform X1 n=1 Tax=Girardinichthys multiradiatus TaxID=208333 RepID=UPI001FAB68B9|nr:uncharacterized protein LOC124861302 isoform X1 [Girardinichthys multiradiatus]
MISYSSKVLFYALISAVLFLPLDADYEDCTTELLVRRNTIYEVFPGQQLRIDCPVVFCNFPPPPVSWYKMEEKFVRLHVNNKNHITVGWEIWNSSRGKSYLLFKNVVKSDSGIYQCETGGNVGHAINITVNGNTETTTTAGFQLWTSSTSKSAVAQDIFWPYMYCLFGIGAFFIAVITIRVISQTALKGRCRKKADPQSSDQIYENVNL